MESGEDDICEEYKESLEDLTFNSKPLINVLTMLAEENSQHASSITKLIATRVRQVCVDICLLIRIMLTVLLCRKVFIIVV